MRRTIFSVVFIVILCALFTDCQENQDARPKIGVLQFSSRLDNVVNDMKREMTRWGYVEGKNITFEYRNAEGDAGTLDSLARELIDTDIDILLALTTPGARAARVYTDRVPVVFSMVSDPLSAGLVENMAQPGENITGVMDAGLLGAPRRLEILKDIDPGITRVLLLHSRTPGLMPGVEKLKQTAETLNLTLKTVPVNTTEEAAAAYDAVPPGSVDAILIPSDIIVIRAGEALTRLMQREHIPSIGDDGNLNAVLTYGPPYEEFGRLTATMLAKTLKGLDPGTLPVETPGRFRLIFSQSQANQIGYRVPEQVFSLADTVAP